jgi:hypothetical protein
LTMVGPSHQLEVIAEEGNRAGAVGGGGAVAGAAGAGEEGVAAEGF